MFYLKNNGKKIEIQEDNVYTICPRCKKEHEVDLADTILTAGENFECFDSMMVFCEDCSEERMRLEQELSKFKF